MSRHPNRWPYRRCRPMCQPGSDGARPSSSGQPGGARVTGGQGSRGRNGHRTGRRAACSGHFHIDCVRHAGVGGTGLVMVVVVVVVPAAGAAGAAESSALPWRAAPRCTPGAAPRATRRGWCNPTGRLCGSPGCFCAAFVIAKRRVFVGASGGRRERCAVCLPAGMGAGAVHRRQPREEENQRHGRDSELSDCRS
jgi:hypothetical protein